MTSVSTYILLRVWEKAIVAPNYDPNIWRKDFAGAWIRKDSYGQHTKYGWEIDHLVPVTIGGSNDLANLMPLHWQNNETKGADSPEFKTSLTSEGNRNIEKMKTWRLQ